MNKSLEQQKKLEQLFSIILGKHIRKKRHEMELTLAELAELIDGDDKHLGKIERGTKCPSSYTLAKIQIALNLNSDDFLNEFEKEREKLIDK